VVERQLTHVNGGKLGTEPLDVLQLGLRRPDPASLTGSCTVRFDIRSDGWGVNDGPIGAERVEP
jgi:hypothetical protein